MPKGIGSPSICKDVLKTRSLVAFTMVDTLGGAGELMQGVLSGITA